METATGISDETCVPFVVLCTSTAQLLAAVESYQGRLGTALRKTIGPVVDILRIAIPRILDEILRTLCEVGTHDE